MRKLFSLTALMLWTIIIAHAGISSSNGDKESFKALAILFFKQMNEKEIAFAENDVKIFYESPDTVKNFLMGFIIPEQAYLIISNHKVRAWSSSKIHASNLTNTLMPIIKWYENTLPSENENSLQYKSIASVEPLLDNAGIQLGQYNHEAAGDCPSGCVATAIAQIMAYYKYPESGKDSNCFNHQSYGNLCANFANAQYNWNNPSDADYKLLSYHIGVAMNMNYCGSSDGSYPNAKDYINVVNKNFKYYYHYGSTENFYIKNELDNARPVYAELPGDPSHAVVIDGYNDAGYFHINFGWNGLNNGYFDLNTSQTMNVGNIFGTNIMMTAYLSPVPITANKQDSIALLAFHNSLNGTTGWDITQSVINWKGVLLMNGRVIKIELDKALEGNISAEIATLIELQVLKIKGVLKGAFPSAITELSKLKTLSIEYYSGSDLVILPTEIGNLTQLEYLKINLKGNIPASIGNLKKLQILDLSNGDLTGDLPIELYSLSELTLLSLQKNKLSGSIHENISQLSKLKFLNLWTNQFSGQLPLGICKLNNLEKLTLSENKFTGTIPDSIGNNNKISELWINNNSFEGNLPNSISQLSLINTLSINNNNFTALPDSIGKMKELQQIVASNNAIEIIPESIRELDKLYRLDLGNNKIKIIPDLGMMPALWDVNLSYNFITEIPESFGELTKLSDLYIDNNQLKQFPSSFQNLKTLRTLSISNNQLSFLPFSFSTLSSLKHLYAQNNYISGNLPPLNHLGLIDCNLRLNRLIFSDIASSQMPDDSVFTDSYEFNYYDQAIVPLNDTIFYYSDGDSVIIDIRKISRLSHHANEYKWFKDNEEITSGAILKLKYSKTMRGNYHCKINNLKYKKVLVLKTQIISIVAKSDSIINNGFITDSKEQPQEGFSDNQVLLVVPDEIRGSCTWQASSDSIKWFYVTDTMSQTSIKQSIISIQENRLLIEAKSKLYFRYIIKEGNCNPIMSDIIRIIPYGNLILDTIINVSKQNVLIAKDSIEIIFPAGFTSENFRLTISKLTDIPPVPDTMKISSVYDVNVSCGTVFSLPLQIKFKNFDRSKFDAAKIDQYKVVYYDDKNRKWVPYENSEFSITDSTIVFNTYHLTKLAWFELAHGSYTHIFTKGRVNVIYKYGVGTEDNSYLAYEYGVKKKPAELWHSTITDPDKNGNPYMIQDIAEYGNQVINKFESLGLEVPSLRFNIYVSILEKGAAGMIDAGGYLAGRGHFYIDPSYCSDPSDLRSTISHEYMHYTQDYYMVMLTQNYFWAEANAPLADRMVWDDTKHEIAEPELLMSQALQPSPDGKMIFDILARPWDYFTNLPLVSKFIINSGDANLSSTFLHYMRSYRTGTKLQPELLLKETPTFSTWAGYLESHIKTYLQSNTGDEYDSFIKYIVEGSNQKFTLLNSAENQDPLKYFQNPTEMIMNKIIRFNGEKMLNDKFQFDLSYLSTKIVQLQNINPNQKIIVKYSRKSDPENKLAVYYCYYDASVKKMIIEDISELDSSSMLIEKSNLDIKERKNIAFLMFINKDNAKSIPVHYDLQIYGIPDFSMLDDFGFYTSYFGTWGGSNLLIHSISDGTKETLDEFNMTPQVFRRFYSDTHPVSYSSNLSDSIYETHAESDLITQIISYNFLTGKMTIYNKENWGGTTPTSTIDVRELTMNLENVYLSPVASNSLGLTFSFNTNNTLETQKTIKNISYNRKYALWNYSLDPPAHNPITNYNYIKTNYSSNNIVFHMQFY